MIELFGDCVGSGVWTRNSDQDTKLRKEKEATKDQGNSGAPKRRKKRTSRHGREEKDIQLERICISMVLVH
jgi:hypothetical protein